MKGLITALLLFLMTTASAGIASEESFNVSLQIVQPDIMDEGDGLTFPEIPTSSEAQTLTLQPIGGVPSQSLQNTLGPAVSVSVVETELKLSHQDSTITIADIDLKGPMSEGQLNGPVEQSISATAQIPPNASGGLYEGDLTLRVSYL